MKTVGLIGGMSWESTITYYQLLNEAAKDALGGLHSAKILLYSVDFFEIEALMSRGDWDAAADLLVPGVGEIIGGSQREERLDMLEKRITELGMELSQYDWYLELRKFGGVKHAGFGLGFERIIMYVTGMQNIRDVLPFPRTTANMEM